MRNEPIGLKLSIELGNLNALPAIPVIAHKLLALPLASEAGEKQMLHLIEQDPQISARIVGLANSPAIGAGRKICSIHDAAMLLGMKRLKSVAVGIATMSELIKAPASKNFDPQNLWSHSMAVAITMNSLSRAMPKEIQPDENQIFLSGLLHDIGLMALHHLDFKASNELHHQLCLQPHRSIHELELEMLGITHGQIGALLVRHWNLPEEIVVVVERHHSPQINDVALTDPLLRLVNIAEKLLPNFGVAEHTSETVGASEWCELGIDPACADDLSALVNELAMQVVQLPDTDEAAEHIEEHVPTSRSVTDHQSKTRFSMLLTPIHLTIRWIGSILR